MFAQAAAETDLNVFEAIILGLVEGLTEYLPVSSTGHLLVATELLGLGGTDEADAALDTYAICIQAGAILAVLLLYQNRIRQMIDGLLGRSEEGKQLVFAIVAAFVPTAIIGLTLNDFVRDRLFGVTPIAIAWIAGGLLILYLVREQIMERGGFELTELTVKHALIIGVAQSIALWPGVSRSFVTILAGVLIGMSLKAAVEFSFLLGLITLTAATAFEGLSNGSELIEIYGVVNPLIGLVVAFVSAIVAVKWMVTWLEERGFGVFGWYRLAVGLLALVLVTTGAI